MIKCTKCGVEKEETDFYWKKSGRINGYACKKCQIVRQKEYYQTEAGKASDAKHRKTDKHKASMARHKKTEKYKETRAKWNNSDKCKASQARWAAKHQGGN